MVTSQERYDDKIQIKEKKLKNLRIKIIDVNFLIFSSKNRRKNVHVCITSILFQYS